MTAERKRGGKFPNGYQKLQAEKLGPYPPWDSWKHVLFNQFPDTIPPDPDVEKIFCLFYNIRRRMQKGEAQAWGDLSDWEKEAERVPGFFENYREVIKFITNKTSTPKRR